MIGPLEIAIVVILALIFFGYKRIPELGRSAGKAVRKGTDKGKEFATSASKKAESVDTKQIARQAGEGWRDVRDLREAVTGDGKGKSGEGRSGEGRSGGESPAAPEPGSSRPGSSSD